MNIACWYSQPPSWFMCLLVPFEWLYGLIIYLRNKAYEKGLLRIHTLPIPVWVVGNMTVGGTGKTPLVMAIVEWLKAQGLQPGIVSRGYGAGQKQFPYSVQLTDTAHQVGDEPLLLAQRTQCPVVIDPNRVRGARALVALGVDIIVSDDGFQHHALYRDCNILLVDGVRRYGNGHCLPVGPLREPLSALQRAHMVVCNGSLPKEHEYLMALQPQPLKPLISSSQATIDKSKPVHAVAGIGHPQGFFDLLEEQGYSIIPHIFPDHYGFISRDLAFMDDYPVIMTEKDAVKCKNFAQSHWWMLPVKGSLEDSFWKQLAYHLTQLGNYK